MISSTLRLRPGRRARVAFLAPLLILMPVPSVVAQPPSPTTLKTALEELRSNGVDLLYSDRLVTDQAISQPLPVKGTLEERLHSLLEPFGLTAKLGKQGVWKIVPRPAGTVHGCLSSGPGDRPVVGALIMLDGAVKGRTDAKGCYRLNRIPVGKRQMKFGAPGFRDARADVHVEPGVAHVKDLWLAVDIEAGEEILVGAEHEEPALGTWVLGSDASAPRHTASLDPMKTLSELPGTQGGIGLAFSVRGREARRLNLVVDGIRLTDPFHYRDLGSLAGAVTPAAVSDIRLYRGAPPIRYGDRAGGLVEMITASPTGRFSGRLSATDESLHSSLHGSFASGQGRWMGAYREGRPKIPQDVVQSDQRPSYYDGLLKLGLGIARRQDLNARVYWLGDELDLSSPTSTPNFEERFWTRQKSMHGVLRHVASLGKSHVLETSVGIADINRRRRSVGHSEDANILPRISEPFDIDDRRSTTRHSLRIEDTHRGSRHLDFTWGLDGRSQRTSHTFISFDVSGWTHRVFEIDERRTAPYGQGTWRPRPGWTLKLGIRRDQIRRRGPDDLIPPRFGWPEIRTPPLDEAEFAPRVSATYSGGSGTWRLAWGRANAYPDSHELRPLDFEIRPEGRERTDLSAVGYSRHIGDGSLAIELFDHRVSDPWTRYINVFERVSRNPEHEVDRIRLQPDASRFQGLEARWQGRLLGGQLDLTYQWGRSEDDLDGTWVPRRSDRRHRLDLWWSYTWRGGWLGAVRYSAASGAPTTPVIKPDRSVHFGFHDWFEDAARGYHTARLSQENRLDLRLRGPVEWKGLRLDLEIGIDNLFDQRAVEGFDITPLRRSELWFDRREVPETLEPQLGLGQVFRWSATLSF